MKILSFIEDLEIIKKILKYLDLWDLKSKPPPRANAPPDNIEPHLDYSDSQLHLHLPAIALAQASFRIPELGSRRVLRLPL